MSISSDSNVQDLLKEAEDARERLMVEGRVRPKQSPTRIRDIHIPCPSHWASTPLEDLFRFIDYRGKTPTKTDSGRVLVTAKNIRPGTINPSPTEYISETSYYEWMTRGFPHIGDLLITTEAPLGNVAQILGEPSFALAQRVITLQPFIKLYTKYFMYFMMSSSFQNLLWRNATGVTAKGIKAAKLRQLRVSVPPFEEQNRIVERVDGLFFLCDQLENQLNRSKTLAKQYAAACTTAVTGIQSGVREKVKQPKTELISNLQVGIPPASMDQSILATILMKNNGLMLARILWTASELEINDFYQQLKVEMAKGWIIQPEVAYMKEEEGN